MERGLGRVRIIVLLLALFGGGYLWMQLSSSEGVRLSGWGGPLRAGSATQALGAPVLRGLAEPQQGRGLPGDLRPQGNPLRAANTVLTQGYGVGSHAPAAVWGAVDLALDGNGDGAADPEGSWHQPIYATHSGVVKTTANSYPAGNHLWVTNDEYRTGYAHLASFAVGDGQRVERGDLIGYIGSTGMSSGPHLDYQVWVRQGDAWVNVNPMDFNVLEVLP